MDRLLQIGFRDIGRWTLDGHDLRLQLDTLPSHRRALYAFAAESAVLYVGKTAGSLPTRLQAYVAPHQTQRTNVRNRAALLDLLRAGAKIRILGWIDPGLHRIGSFDLNLAAGLEDSIIAVLSPPWNGARTAEISAAAPGASTLAPIASTLTTVVPANPATAVKVPISPAASAASSTSLRAPFSTEANSFTVRLGKTYYERGFFNVPVAFSQLFGSHGATVELYGGDFSFSCER
jgi:hypothetical protein